MEALYRKYRPTTFSQVSGQDHVKTTIRNQIQNDNIAHAYLFTGPRGTGKTTIARLVAKAINCENAQDGEPCNACAACEEIADGSALDISEIDAASHTDVANVRENVIESVRFAPNRLDYKVYIIDEVHMLSTHAFNALLKTIEEPPSHAVFVLATTEIHKVPQTIISRCQRFDFQRIPVPAIVERMKRLVKEEGVTVDEDVLFEVARHADGCPRDAESLLGQILALGDDAIDRETASLVLPATTTVLVVDFLDAVLRNDPKTAIRLLNKYVEQGVDMPHFTEDIVAMLRGMLFESLGDIGSFLEAHDSDTQERISALLNEVSVGRLKRSIQVFLRARQRMKADKIPQIRLELAVVDLCDVEANDDGSVPPSGNKTEKTRPAQKTEVSNQTGEVDGHTSNLNTKNEQEDAPPKEPMEEKAFLAKTEDEAPQVISQEDGETVTAKKTTVRSKVPVLSLDEVREKWPQVYKKLKECNASLPLICRSAQLQDINGDVVELGFAYSLHAETVNRSKNRRLIERIMEKVFDTRLRVKANCIEKEVDETVETLLNEFGGSVA